MTTTPKPFPDDPEPPDMDITDWPVYITDLYQVRWYVTKAVEYDGPAIVFDDQWATREAVAVQMRELRDEQLERAAEFRGYAGEERRDESNRARCAKHAQEYEAKAALYETALATLESGSGHADAG